MINHHQRRLAILIQLVFVVCLFTFGQEAFGEVHYADSIEKVIPIGATTLSNYEEISKYYDKLIEWMGFLLAGWGVVITVVVMVGGIVPPLLINRGYEKRLESFERSLNERIENRNEKYLSELKSQADELNTAKLAHRALILDKKHNLAAREEQCSIYTQLIKLEADDERHYYNRGVAKAAIYQIRHDSTILLSAIKDFTVAINLNPSVDEHYSNRASCHSTLGQYSEALCDINKAIGLEPCDHQYQLNKATILQALRSYDDALCIYNKLEHETKCRLDVMLAKAEFYSTSGDLKSAEKLYKQALIASPCCIDTLLKVANILIQLQRHSEADQYVDRIFELNPRNSEALSIKAEILSELLHFESAHKYANTLIELYPSDPLGYYRRGVIYTKQDSYYKALSDLQHAIKLAPAYPQYYIALAELYKSKSEFQSMKNLYNKALELDENNIECYNGLASHYSSLSGEHNKAKADAYLYEVFSRDHNNIIAHCTRIRNLEFHHPESNIIKEYEDLLPIIREWEGYDFFFNMAESYIEKEDFEQASYALKKAFRYCPIRSKKSFIQKYAYCQYKLGRYKLAIRLSR